jgi:hypothetical protein
LLRSILQNLIGSFHLLPMQSASAWKVVFDLEPELCDLLRGLSGFAGPVLSLAFDMVARPALSHVGLRAEVQSLFASHVGFGIPEVASSVGAVPAANRAGCEPGLLAQWISRNPHRFAALVIEPDARLLDSKVLEALGNAPADARAEALAIPLRSLTLSLALEGWFAANDADVDAICADNPLFKDWAARDVRLEEGASVSRHGPFDVWSPRVPGRGPLPGSVRDR